MVFCYEAFDLLQLLWQQLLVLIVEVGLGPLEPDNSDLLREVVPEWRALKDKRLQRLLVIRQAAMETQTLLGLGQPLQQDVNGGVKLLSLRREDTHQPALRHTLPSTGSTVPDSACSSRACLDTDRLHTVSQRVLSSCICTFTQDESSWLMSVRSLAERLRA
ncbi:hypothetical protein F7725_024137 [Dissostichus mawsoni]|uniref:Uncharacterized protein n=1 Tax=Dissostichus mawsoni TaxID=36200 RepID=A0A7J5XYH9_DISMA|nr:hypothetical protein F7725_024137 [Dissostichus mawsoni]